MEVNRLRRFYIIELTYIFTYVHTYTLHSRFKALPTMGSMPCTQWCGTGNTVAYYRQKSLNISTIWLSSTYTSYNAANSSSTITIAPKSCMTTVPMWRSVYIVFITIIIIIIIIFRSSKQSDCENKVTRAGTTRLGTALIVALYIIHVVHTPHSYYNKVIIQLGKN